MTGSQIMTVFVVTPLVVAAVMATLWFALVFLNIDGDREKKETIRCAEEDWRGACYFQNLFNTDW